MEPAPGKDEGLPELIVGGKQAISEADPAAKLHGPGLLRDEAVRPPLYDEAVYPLRYDVAPDPRFFFHAHRREGGKRGGGPQLVLPETVGSGEAGYAPAYYYDPLHQYISPQVFTRAARSSRNSRVVLRDPALLKTSPWVSAVVLKSMSMS